MKFNVTSPKSLAAAILYNYPKYKQAVLNYSNTVQVIDELIKLLTNKPFTKRLKQNRTNYLFQFTKDLRDLEVLYLWRQLYCSNFYLATEWNIRGLELLPRLERARNFDLKNEYQIDIIENVLTLEKKLSSICSSI
jgi:hypothetical protein